MKGILQISLLCYSWEPLQSRLLTIAAVLLLVGHLGLLTFRTGVLALLAFLSFGLGLALMFLPLMFSNRIISPGISAPRTLHLLPYARLQLLLGTLVAALTLALFVTANIALLKLEAPGPKLAGAGLSSVFVGTLGIETAFFIMRSSFFPMFILLLFGLTLLGRLSMLSDVTAKIGATLSGGLLVVFAWGTFAVWYLRTPRISASIWNKVSPARIKKRAEKIDVSRKSAISIYLLGLTRSRLVMYSVLVLVTVLILFCTIEARSVVPASLRDLASLFITAQTSAIAMVAAISVTRRARFLWLCSGSRQELFQLCERLSWRCVTLIIIPALTLSAVAWALLPHLSGDWLQLSVASLVPAMCALYLGFMNVGTLRPNDTVIASLIVLISWGAVIFGPALSSHSPTLAGTLIVVAELFGTLGLRWVAQRRWRRIDWLFCKPWRLASQALRPTV